MTLSQTYDTIAHWLNSCVNDDQIDLCKDVARSFLLERFQAHNEYNVICNIAELRKTMPTAAAPAWDEMGR